MNSHRWQVEALFFRQLETLFISGVSLYDSIVQLERSSTDPSFSLTLDRAAKDIFAGATLSQALSCSDSWFDPLTLRLLEVGEKSGGLGQSLSRISELLETRLRRQRAIISALTYPACLLVVLILVSLLFVIFVAPSDAHFIEDLGAKTPFPTLVLIKSGQLLTNQFFWMSLLMGSFILFAGIRRLYSAQEGFRLWLHSLILELPIIGNLVNDLDTARALEVLASCLPLGVDILSSLKFASGASSNLVKRREILATLNQVQNGQSLAEALRGQSTMNPFAISLLEVGEESGRLDDMSARAGHIIADDANDRIETSLVLLEPLLLCLGGAVAGFVAVGAFLPVMQMVSQF